jgi:hypothetical protein
MIAEIDFIQDDADALRWTASGLGLIVREMVASVLRTARLALADSWNSLKQEAPAMRNGRLAALSALVLSAAFLLTSGFRQALSIAAVTLTDRPASCSGVGPVELDRIRAAAQERSDAKLFAFAALHDSRNEISHQSAGCAVSIDPSLTWIYYDIALHAEPDNQRAEDVATVLRWDPENGLLYLVRAGQLAPQPWPVSVAAKPNGSEPWVQMAARGVDSPRYNSYQRERFELERQIAGDQGSVNPLRLADAFTGARTASSVLVERYAEYALNNAASPDELARQARRIAALGERMMACTSDVEKWEGQKLALKGYTKLESISAGPEKELIVSRAAQLQKPHSLMTADWSWSWNLANALRPSAVTVQVGFLLILIAILMIAGGSAALFIQRGRGSRTITGLLWGSAGTLIAASVACYVAYQPYTAFLNQIMSPETSSDTGIRLTHIYYSYGYPTTPFAGFYLWGALTLLLLVALTAVLARRLRRPAGNDARVSTGC